MEEQKIPQTPIAPIENQPKPEIKSSSFPKWLTVISVVLFLIIAATAGAYFLNKNSDKPIIRRIPSSAEIILSPTPVDETMNWNNKEIFSFKKVGNSLIVENGKTYKIKVARENPFRPNETVYFVDNYIGFILLTDYATKTVRLIKIQNLPNDANSSETFDKMSYFLNADTLVLGGIFGEGTDCGSGFYEDYLLVDLQGSTPQKKITLDHSESGFTTENTQGELGNVEYAGDIYKCRRECWDQTNSFSYEGEKIFSYSTTCSDNQKEAALTFSSGEKELLNKTYPMPAGEKLLLSNKFFDFPIRKNIQLFFQEKTLQLTLENVQYQFDYASKKLIPVKQ